MPCRETGPEVDSGFSQDSCEKPLRPCAKSPRSAQQECQRWRAPSTQVFAGICPDRFWPKIGRRPQSKNARPARAVAGRAISFAAPEWCQIGAADSVFVKSGGSRNDIAEGFLKRTELKPRCLSREIVGHSQSLLSRIPFGLEIRQNALGEQVLHAGNAYRPECSYRNAMIWHSAGSFT